MQLVHQYPVIAPFASILCAEALKLSIDVIQNRKRAGFLNPGGMPSGHSAGVSSLAVTAALTQGLGSMAFAISAVIALVVVYDAISLRHEAGKHAAAINRLRPDRHLRESLGHTPLQALAGAALGAVLTLGLFFL